jgi:FlaA1/EpsC-like NDP-sugar epimerase
MTIRNKIILIFGGTGSLGYELNTRYHKENIIYNFSRDECKHWEMKLYFQQHSNIRFIIGNVADKDIVGSAILRVKPDIIIIASAMKHIDQCELNTSESLKTNVLGTKHISEVIEIHQYVLTNLETVIFVSSDKACSPINHYGLCKAMSENIIVEKAFYIPTIRFINVRYGNVLNSRGSIIPLLHKIGNDPLVSSFKLTHENMTRFVMTLSQSVDLIEYAILNGESGDTIIPRLISMKVKDLMELFREKYNKDIVITGLRSGEKLVESLINEQQSTRMIKNDTGDYTSIKSVLKYPDIINMDMLDYNSHLNPLSKDELNAYLVSLNLL